MKNKRETIRRYEEFQPPKQSREAEVSENTIRFIDEYLDAGSHWKGDLDFLEKMELMQNSDIDLDIVQEHIRKMNINIFLITPFWDAIMGYLRNGK